MEFGCDWTWVAGQSGRSVSVSRSRRKGMRNMTFEPARPLDTDGMPWIPTGPGKSFRPLRFAADGWSELMRLEPGSAVAVHRHTGDVHAFNLAGTREIFGTGERVGPGNYVYEPAGTLDGWGAVGDEPCVVYIKVAGTIEYLGDDGQVIGSVNAKPSARCTWPGAGSTAWSRPRRSAADPANEPRLHEGHCHER